MTVLETPDQIIAAWANDPLEFARDFQLTLDEWQKDALLALTKNDRVAFIASKGVGKSYLEAIVGWWWMVTRKKAQVICTSIDADNLTKGLWKEIRAIYNRPASTYLQAMFEMNTEEAFARHDRAEWFMAKKAWRQRADAIEQAQALAGLHGPAMLWLGDEAGSYHHAIVASGEAMMANAVPGSGNEAKMLLGGNPTDPSGPLGALVKDPDWIKIRINGDPDNPKRSPRISEEWARKLLKLGRDNPYVMVMVLGEFPAAGFNALLGYDDVQASIRRTYQPEVYDRAQRRMGVDVARFGDDATVIYIRQGLKAGPFIKLRGLDTVQVAERVSLEFKRHNCEMVFIDEGGNPGVVDNVRRMLRGIQVRGVSSSEKATDPEKFWNKRAEMCWDFSSWVKTDGGQVPIADLELQEEMTKPTYTFKNGRILIEDKAVIKEVLGRSPDNYDALALTFAAPDMPSMGGPMGMAILQQMARARAKNHDPMTGGGAGDYDPFADRSDHQKEFRGYDPDNQSLGR